MVVLATYIILLSVIMFAVRRELEDVVALELTLILKSKVEIEEKS